MLIREVYLHCIGSGYVLLTLYWFRLCVTYIVLVQDMRYLHCIGLGYTLLTLYWFRICVTYIVLVLDISGVGTEHALFISWSHPAVIVVPDLHHLQVLFLTGRQRILLGLTDNVHRLTLTVNGLLKYRRRKITHQIFGQNVDQKVFVIQFRELRVYRRLLISRRFGLNILYIFII